MQEKGDDNRFMTKSCNTAWNTDMESLTKKRGNDSTKTGFVIYHHEMKF